MAASRHSAAAVGALWLLAAAPLPAQLPLSVTGTTSRLQGSDTVPAAGVAVTLHRVSRTVQGAIDSTRSGPDGGFRFRAAGDTAAIYLVSARHAGIEYFSEPLRAPGSGRIVIVVSDTSSTAPVRLGARHVIIRPPDETGTRAVLDLLSVVNDGSKTRIGRDSLTASWRLLLPAGAVQPEVQEGDVSPTAIQFRGDTLLVLAPIAPGRKNVMVSYRLPVAITRPSWLAPADSFDLLVEEPGATVRGAGLAPGAPVEILGSTLRRWSAAPPSGEAGEVQFGGSAVGLDRALIWLVSMMGLLVAAGGVVAFRRARRPGAGAALARDRAPS